MAAPLLARTPAIAKCRRTRPLWCRLLASLVLELVQQAEQLVLLGDDAVAQARDNPFPLRCHARGCLPTGRAALAAAALGGKPRIVVGPPRRLRVPVGRPIVR